MEILTLLKTHWFDLFQTAAIVSGFIWTALSFSLESRSRLAEFVFKVTTAHREIWSAMQSHPDLARILDPDRKADTESVSAFEETFVLSVILHLSSVHHAILLDLFPDWPGLSEDIRQFFTLPVPSFILRKYLPLQSDEFQQFLARILSI